MPSLNISDQTESPRRPVSSASTASGTAPMPICRVAASGTSAAIRSPIGLRGGERRPVRRRGQRRRHLDPVVELVNGATESPKVYGICGLTWAITMPPRALTVSIAAGKILTSMPRETVPCTGSEVCTRTTSGGSSS